MRAEMLGKYLTEYLSRTNEYLKEIVVRQVELMNLQHIELSLPEEYPLDCINEFGDDEDNVDDDEDNDFLLKNIKSISNF